MFPFEIWYHLKLLSPVDLFMNYTQSATILFVWTQKLPSKQRRVNEPKKRRQWKTRVSWLLLPLPTEHFHPPVFVSNCSHRSCFFEEKQGAIWSHLEIIGSFMGHQADTYRNGGYVTLIKRMGVQKTQTQSTGTGPTLSRWKYNIKDHCTLNVWHLNAWWERMWPLIS